MLFLSINSAHAAAGSNVLQTCLYDLHYHSTRAGNVHDTYAHTRKMDVVTAQTSASGRRHLMAVGNGQPGVEVSMAIPTTAALAAQQSTAIQSAVTTGTLSSEWGKLGNSTRSFCIQQSCNKCLTKSISLWLAAFTWCST